MKLLALEFSTETASLALLEAGVVVASLPVDAGHRRSQGVFDAVEVLLKGAGWVLADVGAFAVGRGPGSYTGLRVSLTAANGWALPANKPVWTVSSGAALAAEIFAEKPEISRAVVWGDARRGTIWAGLFERHARQVEEWKLLPAEARGMEWPAAHWVEAGRAPKAEWVGRLFFAGGPSEELQPIYLHPAVIAAPRFDAEGKPLA
ncbi:MAG TPA: tRNA (adenosine(37)-N6)-threonylcarbamoyltransferase complex dimerization subunit type 1 TsaB [Verrucomicrobia bacterium]|nr:tRNA (adenosine(37)-N6)-threonylcarbamoyltransferase complex dimerization subunit type 1 TsaB [Verrucomicrobiota bacterium]